MIDLDQLFPYAFFKHVDEDGLKIRSAVRILMGRTEQQVQLATELLDVAALFGVEIESADCVDNAAAIHEIHFVAEDVQEVIAIIAWLNRRGRQLSNLFEFVTVP